MIALKTHVDHSVHWGINPPSKTPLPASLAKPCPLKYANCASPPFLGNLENFVKKEALALVFSCEFCKIYKNTFFTEHLQWLFFIQIGNIFIIIRYSKNQVIKVEQSFFVDVSRKQTPLIATAV